MQVLFTWWPSCPESSFRHSFLHHLAEPSSRFLLESLLLDTHLRLRPPCPCRPGFAVTLSVPLCGASVRPAQWAETSCLPRPLEAPPVAGGPDCGRMGALPSAELKVGDAGHTVHRLWKLHPPCWRLWPPSAPGGPSPPQVLSYLIDFFLSTFPTKVCMSQGLSRWLSGRVHPAMQETHVPSLTCEDPTCLRAAKPVRHNCPACSLEPRKGNR